MEGIPDGLRLHDLRGTGATWAAIEGATLKELMDRLGHSTINAALFYQRTAEDRDRELADRMCLLMDRWEDSALHEHGDLKLITGGRFPSPAPPQNCRSQASTISLTALTSSNAAPRWLFGY